MSSCLPCISNDCRFPNDLDLYSLDGLAFAGGALFQSYDCPPATDCDIQPVVPWIATIACCGHTLVSNVGAGASLSQINAAYVAMIQECSRLTAECWPTTTPAWSIRVRCCNTVIVANIPANATPAQIYNAVEKVRVQYASLLTTCNTVAAALPESDCRGCIGLNCDFPNDLELYSLDGLNFFLTGRLYYVFNCPPEYDCSVRPTPWQLRIQCCDNVWIVGNVPGGASYAQITVIWNAMVAECNSRKPGCAGAGTPAWEIRRRCCGVWIVGYVPANATPAQVANVYASVQQQYDELLPTCNTPVPDDPVVTLELKADIIWGPLNFPHACLNAAFARTFSVQHKYPVVFTLINSSLAGATLEQVGPKSAQLKGKGTVPGVYTFEVQGKSAVTTSSHTYTVNILGLTNGVPDVLGVIALTAGEECTEYFEQLIVDGEVSPVTFGWDSYVAPSWVNVSASGYITGVPPDGSGGINYPFNVYIQDASGLQCTQPVSIAVAPIDCETMGNPGVGVVDKDYFWQLIALGGSGPHKFTLTGGGSMPPGLGLLESGLIIGTPTQTGTFVFGINVQSKYGCVCQYTLTMIIYPHPCDANEIMWKGYNLTVPSVCTGVGGGSGSGATATAFATSCTYTPQGGSPSYPAAEGKADGYLYNCTASPYAVSIHIEATLSAGASANMAIYLGYNGGYSNVYSGPGPWTADVNYNMPSGAINSFTIDIVVQGANVTGQASITVSAV